MNAGLILLAGALFYASGEVWSKLYANTHRLTCACTALVFYLGSAICFLRGLSRINSLSVYGTLWNVSYALVTVAIGAGRFHEPVTLRQWLGILSGVAAILLLL